MRKFLAVLLAVVLSCCTLFVCSCQKQEKTEDETKAIELKRESFDGVSLVQLIDGLPIFTDGLAVGNFTHKFTAEKKDGEFVLGRGVFDADLGVLLENTDDGFDLFASIRVRAYGEGVSSIILFESTLTYKDGAVEILYGPEDKKISFRIGTLKEIEKSIKDFVEEQNSVELTKRYNELYGKIADLAYGLYKTKDAEKGVKTDRDYENIGLLANEVLEDLYGFKDKTLYELIGTESCDEFLDEILPLLFGDDQDDTDGVVNMRISTLAIFLDALLRSQLKDQDFSLRETVDLIFKILSLDVQSVIDSVNEKFGFNLPDLKDGEGAYDYLMAQVGKYSLNELYQMIVGDQSAKLEHLIGEVLVPKFKTKTLNEWTDALSRRIFGGKVLPIFELINKVFVDVLSYETEVKTTDGILTDAKATFNFGYTANAGEIEFDVPVSIPCGDADLSAFEENPFFKVEKIEEENVLSFTLPLGKLLTEIFNGKYFFSATFGAQIGF